MPEIAISFDPRHMTAAYEQAIKDSAQGAIPIGSVIVYDDGQRVEVFEGRNQRVQQNSAIRHAEMDCLENAGSRPAAWYKQTTLFSTLWPCAMCSGAIALFGIPRVVIGEAINFPDAEGLKKGRAFFELHGVEYTIVNDQRCITTLAEFIQRHPEKWDEDVPYQDITRPR